MITIFISWIKNFFFNWKKPDDNNYKIVVVEPLINNSYKKNYSGIFITESFHNVERDCMTDDEHEYFLNDVDNF